MTWMGSKGLVFTVLMNNGLCQTDRGNQQALVKQGAAVELGAQGHSHEAYPDMQTPAGGRAKQLLQCSKFLRGRVLTSDVVDLEAGDAQIIQLAVGELRKLPDGIAITHVGTDLRENVSHEHRELLSVSRPSRPAPFVLACAMQHIGACSAEEEW